MKTLIQHEMNPTQKRARAYAIRAILSASNDVIDNWGQGFEYDLSRAKLSNAINKLEHLNDLMGVSEGNVFIATAIKDFKDSSKDVYRVAEDFIRHIA